MVRYEEKTARMGEMAEARQSSRRRSVSVEEDKELERLWVVGDEEVEGPWLALDGCFLRQIMARYGGNRDLACCWPPGCKGF